ncbi:hypothetical protein PDJAM_G00170060 [Pangasius djambal]|uniref:Uncharacterized protein n=1 Tax=Pangasius djambal TaxID=1691987 RepID=A0ACC5ZLL1_9TELE|nr:hypothetical protein [Pangasius djambal]
MVAKVVKLAVVPAALGLASFRVYAVTEEKTDEQFSPRELSVYSTEPPALRYVEEKPGHLQAGFGLMRVGLQRYVRAVQNTCTSVKVGAISLYRAGQDAYNFLRDPPPGFLPRVGIITVSGLAGLILARKGSRLKRIGVPLALTTAGAAVCYPTRTVGVLKVTGKKAYAASSLVASAFRSKPKEEGIVPDASLEHASEEVAPVTEVVPQPDELPENVPFLPEGESVSEVASVTEVAPVSGNSLTIDAVAEEVAPVSEDSLTSDDITEVTPGSQAADIAQAEVVSLVEGSSVVPLTPVPDLAPEDVIPSEVVFGVGILPVDTVVEFTPQEKTTPVSGDVALEAVTHVSVILPTEKAPVAEVTQLSDVTRSTLVDPVTPTEDARVLNTAPLADVSLKEATSEDNLAAEVTPLIDVAAEETSPVSEDSPAIEVSPAEVASLGEDVGAALIEMTPSETAVVIEVSLVESSPAVDITSDDVEVTEVVENLPESAARTVEETTPPPLDVEETTPPPLDVEETTPPPLDVEETTSPARAVEETLPSPLGGEETTPPLDVEETTPPPLNVEETTPPPAKEITTCPPVKEKPRFDPDPSLLDHGQAHPEDADLYSTRG